MASDEARGREEEAKRRELLERMEEELNKLKVSDLLVQTLYTVSSLGYRKLAPEDRDLGQARLAIEALRALVPVLKDAVPEGVVRDFNEVIANMQLAYASAAEAQKGGSEGGGG